MIRDLSLMLICQLPVAYCQLPVGKRADTNCDERFEFSADLPVAYCLLQNETFQNETNEDSGVVLFCLLPFRT